MPSRVLTFLHCSDVHITASYRERSPSELGWRRSIALLELSVGGRSRAYARASETLRALAAQVTRGRAAHLVLSGDVTAYALQEEFSAARAVLSGLLTSRQVTIVPGNHDTYARDAVDGRYFERSFGEALASDLPDYAAEGPYPLVRLLGDEAAIVGLSSARLTPAPGIAAGYVGAAQLRSLSRLVEDRRLAGRAILVAVHHAPRTRSGRPDRVLHGLVDARALMRLLPGPRFAILHGHIHQRYHHPANDERPHLFGAGSSTEEGHEGGWLIDVDAGRVSGWRQLGRHEL